VPDRKRVFVVVLAHNAARTSAQTVAALAPEREAFCRVKHFPEASWIEFFRSVKYGLGVVAGPREFRLQKSVC
jgi:hypothetical protein